MVDLPSSPNLNGQPECANLYVGTLMAPQVLSRVCHGSHKSLANPNMTTRPAVLHRYRRHKVKNADYPAILPHIGFESSVRGTVVSGLTDGDLWRLDIFEGDEYERQRVKVRILSVEGAEDGTGQVESDEEVEAEAYVWIAGADRLEDNEWDFGEFVREKMSRWVGVEGDGEYKGRDSYRRASMRKILCARADDQTEVDEAVKAAGDPTGGRGLNGHIGQAVESSRSRGSDAVASAV